MVATAHGQVYSSEFLSDPVSEGWQLFQQYCGPATWNANGRYHQRLGFPSCNPPDGGTDSYTRWITDYNGVSRFFFEFRVFTNGDRSEIPGGAPTALTTGNYFGISYHVTLARDQVKLLRDVDLPILFIDLEQGVPHTIRLELDNRPPETYRWYVDGTLIDEGLAEGAYPSEDARLTWRGKAWYLPCENAWDYIRYGVTPQDASGDFDSDDDVDERDFYFLLNYLSGPNADAGPGGRFADFDGDTDIDLADFAAFQRAFTGGE